MEFIILIFICSLFISSISQIFLKFAANINYDLFIKRFTNWKVLFGYFLLFLSSLITIFCYRTLPLHYGVILESIGYVLVIAFGYFFFKEKITKKKLIGCVLIILGIIICFV